ncbi:MAG: coth protein-domain-containing protein [Benjaminiella poitrasii]|nr:MAG: coth protein-domain-containing protein [Benjaminiella poitrasii]
MRIASAFIVFCTALIATATALPLANVNYKVILLVPNNETVGVLVDNTLYPLTDTSYASTLLHIGEAPVANTGYKYAIVDKNNNTIIDEEPFTRSPVINGTLNEYYGRSWNTKSLDKLPTIMDPLPIINRIESDLHIDGQIPTIHFVGNQTAFDYMHSHQLEDIDITTNMTYISANDIKTFEGITLAVSGRSTRMAGKLSYKVKIPKKNDLYGYRRLKLRSMAFDTTYMREELAYNIAESVGLPSTRYSYARLYINERPIGLFGLTEAFKNPWIRNEFADGNKKYNQGTLFTVQNNFSVNKLFNQTSDNTTTVAGVSNSTHAAATVSSQNSSDYEAHVMSDLSYLGSNVTIYSQGYTAKEKPSSGLVDYTRLMELTKFISEQSNATIISNDVVPLWQEKLDMDSVLRALAFEIIVSDPDGYLVNGNNYLLYEDLEKERFVMTEQDFDLTMGASTQNSSLLNLGNWTNFPGVTTSPLSSSMLRVPEFKTEFERIIFNFTKGIMNPTILFPRIDQLYSMLEEDVAWDSSLPTVAENLMFELAGGLMNSTDSQKHVSLAQMFPFNVSVNGHSDFGFNMGLKEWVSLRSSNIMTFFNGTL